MTDTRWSDVIDKVEIAAKAVERERCALLVESFKSVFCATDNDVLRNDLCDELAANIRAATNEKS